MAAVTRLEREQADIRKRGIYASLAETSKPYISAVWANYSSKKTTITEHVLSGRLIVGGCKKVFGWFRRGKKRPDEPGAATSPEERA